LARRGGPADRGRSILSTRGRGQDGREFRVGADQGGKEKKKKKKKKENKKRKKKNASAPSLYPATWREEVYAGISGTRRSMGCRSKTLSVKQTPAARQQTKASVLEISSPRPFDGTIGKKPAILRAFLDSFKVACRIARTAAVSSERPPNRTYDPSPWNLLRTMRRTPKAARMTTSSRWPRKAAGPERHPGVKRVAPGPISGPPMR